MRQRHTVEKYWSVWILNNHPSHTSPFWEPFDEGMTTKRAAMKTMREEQERHPDEQYTLVFTVNTRLRSTQVTTRSSK